MAGRRGGSLSSPRGPPTSLWSREGAGSDRGARTGWGAVRPGSASCPSSASSPSTDLPLGRGGWVGILGGWRSHCRFSKAVERTDEPGAPGRGATRVGGEGGEETPCLPDPSRGSDPRG